MKALATLDALLSLLVGLLAFLAALVVSFCWGYGIDLWDFQQTGGWTRVAVVAGLFSLSEAGDSRVERYLRKYGGTA